MCSALSLESKILSVKTLSNLGEIIGYFLILELINYFPYPAGDSKGNKFPDQKVVVDFVVRTTLNYHFFTSPLADLFLIP